MMTSENFKLKSTREQIREPEASRTCSMGAKQWPFREQTLNPVSSRKEEQRPKPQPASAQTGKGYLAGTSFKKPDGQSPAPDREMSQLSSCPANLEAGHVLALHPSGAHSSKADRTTLVEEVIEQLRLARLRRHRPH
jgi:hypothetical protein